MQSACVFARLLGRRLPPCASAPRHPGYVQRGGHQLPIDRSHAAPARAHLPASHPADALVVFAGGRGERLSKALVLVQQHVAPVLVISNGRDARWQAANQLCASRQRFEVLCPQPDPDTTRGEARMVQDLAARRGWRSVVVVTSTYHARRAQLLLGRCFDGQLQIVAASPHEQWLRTWARANVELAGLLRALVTAPDC